MYGKQKHLYIKAHHLLSFKHDFLQIKSLKFFKDTKN